MQVTLLLWLVTAAGGSPSTRRMLSVAAAVLLYIIPTGLRIGRDHRANQKRTVAAIDLFQPLYRDLAATLRATQPEGGIVVLASPNASAGIGYYGRFQALGTLFWENAAGLRAAAEILCAGTEAEALRRIHERGITHVAMLSPGTFVEEYFSLLHPGRPRDDAKRTFGFRLSAEPAAGPRWLQPIPYRRPAELVGTGADVRLFKVVPGQTEDQR